MATTPFKRLGLKDFNDICRAVPGWDSEIRYTFQIHGQEFNSFQRKTRSKRFATPDLVLHSE